SGAELNWRERGAVQWFIRRLFRKSYPDVLVMQPSQDWNGDYGASPLDGSWRDDRWTGLKASQDFAKRGTTRRVLRLK
ncbi:MAG: hypothetical protein WBX35_07550, partial [Pseudolabrys sp.]